MARHGTAKHWIWTWTWTWDVCQNGNGNGSRNWNFNDTDGNGTIQKMSGVEWSGERNEMKLIEMRWNSMEWDEVDWNGMQLIRMDWIRFDSIRFDSIGLDWIGLDWIGLDWIGLDWIGLDMASNDMKRNELDWTECNMEWIGHGMECNAMERNEMERNGMEWNGHISLEWQFNILCIMTISEMFSCLVSPNKAGWSHWLVATIDIDQFHRFQRCCHREVHETIDFRPATEFFRHQLVLVCPAVFSGGQPIWVWWAICFSCAWWKSTTLVPRLSSCSTSSRRVFCFSLALNWQLWLVSQNSSVFRLEMMRLRMIVSVVITFCFSAFADSDVALFIRGIFVFFVVIVHVCVLFVHTMIAFLPVLLIAVCSVCSIVSRWWWWWWLLNVIRSGLSCDLFSLVVFFHVFRMIHRDVFVLIPRSVSTVFWIMSLSMRSWHQSSCVVTMHAGTVHSWFFWQFGHPFPLRFRS